LFGQVNIEFILSASVFLLTLTFISFTIVDIFPNFHNEAANDILKAKAFQASELLIMDEGDWSADLEDVKRIGLSTGDMHILNKSKILALNNCDKAEYNEIKKLLGLTYEYDFILNITEINFTGSSSESWECKPSVVSLITKKFWIKRLVVIDDGADRKIAKLQIVVY